MASTTAKDAGKSWADDVDDETDFDGVRTSVTFYINDAGKKIKVTRKTRLVPQKQAVNHDVARRLALPKFGNDKGQPAGPDRATTTVGEAVMLKLSIGGKPAKGEEPDKEESEEKNVKDMLKKSAGGGKVICRLCKGEHFTAKCPYKDTLGGIDGDAAAGDLPPAEDAPPVAAASTSGGGSKYVPPSVRNRGAGDKMGGPGGSRDDLPTLRITNISEDTQEQDLRDLFGPFGRVARVYVGRDRETGAGKGFAFVSFESRDSAQKAIDKVNGRGYDNLILSVSWSQPRADGR
ncbi:translation initiation factor 3, RNA-binding subunit [Flagelloscypha sp. PMI_526]|nr:translation initiation factor 3, RNA-binding subunit [Flagelloscypha sp. PMI_526]